MPRLNMKKILKNKHSYKPDEKDIRRAADLIHAILDENAPDDIYNRMIAWFGSDLSLEEKFEALELIMRETLSPNMQPDDEDRRKFMELLQRLGLDKYSMTSPRRKIRQKPTLTRILFRMVAVLLPLALLAGVYFWLVQPETAAPQPFVAEYYISVPTNECKKVVLDDGTEVVLNKETEFSYSDDRECELHGEGYFKVVKSDKPFIIHTDHMDIIVLGTEFNLCAYDDYEMSTVTLYSGLIKLEFEEGEHTLLPGSEFTYNHQTGHVNVRLLDMTEAETKPSWLSVSNSIYSLGAIFSSLESTYGITIENKEVADTSKHYSFGFNASSDSIELLMSTLSAVSGDFSYSISGSTIKLEPVTQ